MTFSYQWSVRRSRQQLEERAPRSRNSELQAMHEHVATSVDRGAHDHREGSGTDGHHAAGGHDKHAGHSVEMFRQKFWGTLALSIPTIIWAPMIQHWFRYEAPGGPLASRWIPA